MEWIELESLPKETLLKVIKMYSKNWVTVDGLWFRNVEDDYGLDAALRLDLRAWERLSLIEARRIKETLDLTPEGPLAVMQALTFMTWTPCFLPLKYEERSAQRVIFGVPHCPPQEARVRQGLGEFPCRPMGVAGFSNVAKVIDPRVKVSCLFCPPGPHPQDLWCKWELTTGSQGEQMEWMELESLSEETLLKVIKMYSRNWLTIDGLWFQGVEDEYGLDAALKIDLKVWERQSLIEARRIKETLNLTGEGPRAVMQAFNFLTAMPSFALPEYEEKNSGGLVVSFPHCPVQETRLRQGRGEFPCKPVGITQFSGFAEVIDPRVKVKCLFCPPDPHPEDIWCKWELTS